MAFSNIDGLNYGKFLQIAFSAGIRNQISDDYRDWEQIKQVRVGAPDGRELRFTLQTAYGSAAVQYRNPNFTSSFPTEQQATTSEHAAVYKELDATVMIEYNLWNRAQKSPAKYAEPLAFEIQSKTIACKRRMAADLYGDGTGVVGQVTSVTDTTGAGGSTLVTLTATDTARGHIGFFEFGDLLVAKELDGSDRAPTTVGTFYAWRVKTKDRPNDRVVLEPVDASGSVLNLTASNLVATDVFYRVGQPTFPDLTSPIADYGSVTEVVPGLESLVAADGRVIHGITMSGATAGSVYDASATAFDVSQIQAALDQTKINVGQSSYRFKKMCMAPEAHAKLIESRETDRRFHTVEDAARGIKVFGYQHGNDFLESYTSEYCPKKRLYIMPENSNGKDKVLEYHGTDFEPVRMGGMGEFHLKPSSSGGHERRVVSYMESLGTLICKHPAAVTQIRNFAI